MTCTHDLADFQAEFEKVCASKSPAEWQQEAERVKAVLAETDYAKYPPAMTPGAKHTLIIQGGKCVELYLIIEFENGELGYTSANLFTLPEDQKRAQAVVLTAVLGMIRQCERYVRKDHASQK